MKKVFLIIILLFLAVFAKTLYALFVNFNHEDYYQIYLIGLKSYVQNGWPYMGPDVVWTKAQIPGALQGLLVAIPFYLLEIPESPFILLNIISVFSISIFSYYISKRIKGIPLWFIWCWLIIAPWLMFHGSVVLNPAYVLPISFLFFIAFFELIPLYEDRFIGRCLSFFILGFGLSWSYQLHMSFVMFLPYIGIAFLFSIKKGFIAFIKEGLSFLIGVAIPLLLLIPTFLKYGMSQTGGIESNITFNINNFSNFFDLLLRFFNLSSFESLILINGDKMVFIYNNLWVAPFLIIVLIIGSLQPIYYIISLFLKSEKKEWKIVRLILILTFVLLFISYFFAKRHVGTRTFIILLPVVMWYSFYALERFFTYKHTRKIAILFLFSGLMFHIAVANSYYEKKSLFTVKEKIITAFKEKDSRLFKLRRLALWEHNRRICEWNVSVDTTSGVKLSFSNDFEYKDKYIIPENFIKENNGNHICRTDIYFVYGFDYRKSDLSLLSKCDSVSLSFKYKTDFNPVSELLLYVYESGKLKNKIIINDFEISKSLKHYHYKYKLPANTTDFYLCWKKIKDINGNAFMDDFEISFYNNGANSLANDSVSLR